MRNAILLAFCAAILLGIHGVAKAYRSGMILSPAGLRPGGTLRGDLTVGAGVRIMLPDETYVITDSTGDADTGISVESSPLSVGIFVNASGFTLNAAEAINTLPLDQRAVIRDDAGNLQLDDNIEMSIEQDIPASPSCAASEIIIDTGGATTEICFCVVANTPLCAALAAGPAD